MIFQTTHELISDETLLTIDVPVNMFSYREYKKGQELMFTRKHSLDESVWHFKVKGKSNIEICALESQVKEVKKQIPTVKLNKKNLEIVNRYLKV